HRVVEAAEAGAVQPDPEGELEHRAGRGAMDRQLGRERIRNRQVALPSELERLHHDLDLVAVLLARPEPQLTEAEDGHPCRVTTRRAGTRRPARVRAGGAPWRAPAPTSRSRSARRTRGWQRLRGASAHRSPRPE